MAADGVPPVPEPERAEGPAPLLPAGCAFEGLVSFRGRARLEGRLRGRVVARGRLEIGPEARVEAQVDVDELVVEGALEGELRARVRAELAASAQVRGTLEAPRVGVAEGALLEGRCHTGPRAAARAADAPQVPSGAPDPGGERSAPPGASEAPGGASPAADPP